MATARPVELPLTLHVKHPDYTRERYDTAQAALYLNVPISSVYTAIGTKTIGHRRQGHGRGGRVRFSQADLDAWRESQRVEPESRIVPRRERAARVAELHRLIP